MEKLIKLESCHVKRALQMLIAAIVAITIYKTLNINYGYWIALSALITIQATTGASIKRARDRLSGTVMGVLLGVALVNLVPPNTLTLIILVPLLIFLIIYLFGTSYTYSIFFGSILLILLMATGTSSPWHFAFARIADTAIGLAIGIAASYLLWPNASQDELQQILRQTVCSCETYFKMVTHNYLTQQPLKIEALKEEVENALLKSINSFKTFSYEPGIMKVTAEAVYAFIVSMNAIYNSLIALTLAASESNLHYLSEHEIDHIKQFINKINAGFSQIVLNFNPVAQPIEFNFDLFRTDVSLIDKQKVKTILNESKPSEVGLILFVYQLKKIAFELKYMNQAVQQLTHLQNNMA